MNWNYILFGAAGIGLVLFLPIGILLTVIATLHYITTLIRPTTKNLNSYFKEDLYEDEKYYKYA